MKKSIDKKEIVASPELATKIRELGIKLDQPPVYSWQCENYPAILDVYRAARALVGATGIDPDTPEGRKALSEIRLDA